MAIPHAASGELIDVLPLGAKLRQTRSSTLVRADHLEVFRMVLPAGKTSPDHKAVRRDHHSMPQGDSGARGSRTNTGTSRRKHGLPVLRGSARGQGAGGLFPSRHRDVEARVIRYKPGALQRYAIAELHRFFTLNGDVP
jgi:hypothetical protein